MALLLDSRSDISGLDKSLWDKVIAEVKRVPKNVAKIAAKAKSLQKEKESAAAIDQTGASQGYPVQYAPNAPQGMSTNMKIGIGLAGLGVVTLVGILIMKMRK